MMAVFHEAGTAQQILLLILSQFTVISLISSAVLLLRHRSGAEKLAAVCAMLLVNMTLYVLMQLDSRITGSGERLRLQIPYAVPLLITVLSLFAVIRILLDDTRNRKIINPRSIKEAFDNLPTGVCFFNETGLPVLCNPAMQRFSFSVCGKDVQYVTDLEQCLSGDLSSASQVRKDGHVFILGDGSAWHLEKRSIVQENGNRFTQYLASDVTDLHKSRVQLQQENEQLRRVQAELKRLSANVVAITREEEILNTKMRVHDEMGRCLVAAQKYLKEDNAEPIPDSLAVSWQRAVSMIKYNNDTPDEDMMLQIRKTCEYLKIGFRQSGTLPAQEQVAYLLTCVVRECVTNAVRYAEATELYAAFSETETDASVTVTNNGRAPEGEITEGGGLSTLRRRVERTGGTMLVSSSPRFRLTVTVPKRKEGLG